MRADLELVDDPVEAPRPEDPVPRDDVQVPGAGILGEVRHRYGAANRAACWEGFAGEHTGKSGLARPVSPDEADPVPGRDLEGHRLEKLAASGSELDFGGGDHEGSLGRERSWCGSGALRVTQQGRPWAGRRELPDH